MKYFCISRMAYNAFFQVLFHKYAVAYTLYFYVHLSLFFFCGDAITFGANQKWIQNSKDFGLYRESNK